MIDRRERFVSRPLPGSRRYFGGSQPAGATTSTTNSAPWVGQQPYISGQGAGTGAQYGAPGGATTTGIAGLLPSANALYGDTSAWPQYFPSSTYAPMGTEQSDLINQITGYGMSGGDQGLQNANSTLAGMLGPAGTAATSPAFASTQNYVNSAVNGGQGVNQTAPTYGADLNYMNNTINGQGVAQTAPVYGQGLGYLSNQIAGQGVGQTQGAFNTAQNYLQGMAGGDTLNPFTSPGFQNVINGTLANVIPATSASFINGGRADSGLAEAAQTAAATNAIGSLANQNYTQEQGLQQGAAGMASQNQLAQQQLQNSAEQQAQQAMQSQQGLQSTAAGQGLSAMLGQQGLQQGAAGLGSNNYLTQQGNQVKAAAVAPGVDQSQLGDLSTGLSAQGQAQQNAQNQINAAVQQWNYQQTLPYNMLGMYQGYTGGNYGGSGNVSTPYFENQTANVLGGITGTANTLGSLGLLGAALL